METAGFLKQPMFIIDRCLRQLAIDTDIFFSFMFQKRIETVLVLELKNCTMKSSLEF